MKKALHYFKLLLMFAFFLSIRNSSAQSCPVTIQVAQGAGGSVSFTANTASTFTAVNWYFSTGTSINSSTPNLSLTITQNFTVNGTYTVSLQALGTCTAAAIQTFVVSNAGCFLNAAYSISQNTTGALNYTNNTTGTSTATTYTIGWGDGTFGGSLPHQYAANGVYTTTLFASNNSTPVCTSAATQVATINSIPVCSLTASYNDSVYSGGSVELFNVSTGTNVSTTYTIAWGDGTYDGPNPHQYTVNGVYTPTLFANNNSTLNCTDQFGQSITVNTFCSPMSPAFTYTIGQSGTFSVTSTSTGTTSSTSYQWLTSQSSGGPDYIFANGAPFGAVIYTVNGTYTVSLILYGTAGCTYSTSLTVVITNASPPCTASFVYSQAQSGSVSFSSTSTGITGYDSFNWYFGDSATSHVPTPSHTYSVGGNYLVILLIQDTITYSSCSIQQTIIVAGPTPTCNLLTSFAHTVGTSGFVTFASISTGTTVNDNYLWDFGDGYITTGNPASHIYQSGGAYNVMLTVNDTICSDSIIQSINVSGSPCIANANFLLASTSTAQVVNATPLYPWNAVGAHWNWGDGTSTDSLYTTHAYATSGNYSICLTILTSCGDTSTYCTSFANRSVEATGFTQVNVKHPTTLPTSMVTIEADELDYTVFPNPTSGEFTLLLNTNIQSNTKLAIYSIVGALVYEIKTDNDIQKQNNMNVSDLPNGIYFIKMGVNNRTYTKKLIISR